LVTSVWCKANQLANSVGDTLWFWLNAKRCATAEGFWQVARLGDETRDAVAPGLQHHEWKAFAERGQNEPIRVGVGSRLVGSK
jgi:uncharacterized membrane protein